MLNLLIKSLKDFLDKRILLLSVLPLFISALVIGLLFFIFSNKIHQFFIWIANYIPFVSSSSVANIAQSIISLTFFYQLMVMMSVMFVGLVADKIADRINAKNYQMDKQGFGTLAGSITTAIKANLLFILLLILFSPTLFIPGVNIVVHIFLWSVLIKSPLFYDSLAFYASKNQFKQIRKNNKQRILLLSLALSCLFFIPVFGVFLYVFQLIVFIHFNLGNLKQLTADKSVESYKYEKENTIYS